jgi:hypothetical protein
VSDAPSIDSPMERCARLNVLVNMVAGEYQWRFREPTSKDCCKSGIEKMAMDYVGSGPAQATR